VRRAGFEAGIHCWDHVLGQDFVASRDAAGTEPQMQLACERFRSIFTEKPRAWAAAGWQTNVHAARYQERAGFAYASDTRGSAPFLPAWGGCAQLPTTLPTLDELIGRDGIDGRNAGAVVLQLTSQRRQAHVFTAHAELEGGRLAGVLEQLVKGWSDQGYQVTSLEALFRTLEVDSLPRHEIVPGEVAGRSGRLAVQGMPVTRAT
jgi:peptidoglycan/xylan/chitin deacetylase (PgdA/CDA1 family)